MNLEDNQKPPESFLSIIKTEFFLARISIKWMSITYILEFWKQAMSISNIFEKDMVFGDCMEWICQIMF